MTKLVIQSDYWMKDEEYVTSPEIKLIIIVLFSQSFIGLQQELVILY